MYNFLFYSDFVTTFPSGSPPFAPANGFPAAVFAPVVMVTVYNVSASKLSVGVKIAVVPEYESVPA